MTLSELTRLQWSWRGPTEVHDEDGTHWKIEIVELPDFFVAGATRDEALVEAGPGLRSFLQSYLENNEVPPLPADRASQWIFIAPSRKQRRVAHKAPSLEAAPEVPQEAEFQFA